MACECWYSVFKQLIWCSNRERAVVLLSFSHVVPLDGGNCCLTMSDRTALYRTSYLWALLCRLLQHPKWGPIIRNQGHVWRAFCTLMHITSIWVLVVCCRNAFKTLETKSQTTRRMNEMPGNEWRINWFPASVPQLAAVGGCTMWLDVIHN